MSDTWPAVESHRPKTFDDYQARFRKASDTRAIFNFARRADLERVLPIAIALIALTKLIDFAFYSAHLNDLAGAFGFVLLLVGSFMSKLKIAALHGVASKVSSSLVCIGGGAIVVVHFLVKWKITEV